MRTANLTDSSMLMSQCHVTVHSPCNSCLRRPDYLFGIGQVPNSSRSSKVLANHILEVLWVPLLRVVC